MDPDGGWAEYTQSWDHSRDDLDLRDSVVTALGVDPCSEALYAGDSSGRLTTYAVGDAGSGLERLAWAQCAHTPVRRVLALAGGARVFVQTDDSVQVRTAGGRRVFMRATTPNDAFTASTLAAGGGVEGAFVCTSAGSGSLLSLAQHGAVVRRVAVELSAVAVDFRSDALLLATVGGDLVLRDPRAGFGVALAARKAFGSNGCMVTDMVRCGSRVFACGSPAVPAHGAVVRLFDLRNLGGPAGDVEPGPGEADHSPVRLHADAQRLWICHDSGLLTTRALGGSLDVDEPFAEPPLSSYAYMSAFCVAPSGAAAAVADTDGIVHVWGETAGRGAPLLSTGRVPDLHVGGGGGGGGHAALDGVSFDDVSVPLSAAAMPPYAAPLLSRSDIERLCDVGRPAAFVDERVLGSLRLMGAVGYAPNPRSQRRNQLPFAQAAWRQRWRAAGSGADELTCGRPKFISQQRRQHKPGDRDQADRADQPLALQPAAAAASAPATPSHLRRMRIEYSRFGVEDFDFSLYNRTRWSGLEGDVANAYANALLQLLFFAPRFRRAAEAHSAGDTCVDAACLSCHLGFLFRMLASAGGASCHASLLLRVLAERPEAAALALLEDADGNAAAATPYAVLAQRLLRFVLEQAAAECAGRDPPLIGFAQRTRTVCPACGEAAERAAHVFAADLDPPQGSAALASLLAGGAASVRRADTHRAAPPAQPADFLALIARALARSDTTRAWCAGCRSFQLLRTDKRITQPPAAYLALNFPVLDSAWQLALPAEFELRVGGGDGGGDGVAGSVVRAAPRAGDDVDGSVVRAADDEPAGPACRMQLVGVVSSIRDSPRGAEHLVAHVREPGGGAWLLMNDFLVQPVAESAVVALGDWWRTPAIALYAVAAHAPAPAPAPACAPALPALPTRILTAPASVLDSPPPHPSASPAQGAQQQRRLASAAAVAAARQSPHVRAAGARRNAAVPLVAAEAALLASGAFRCALDAEFVVLEAAKMEVFSDGTHELHRPPVHVLARLSVVRANGGLLHGLPFIDDYVAATRPIEDLATQYSGIHAGDLTVGASPHKLSAMKEVYRKLRLLVDAKATIIGHGLKHDFRVCNIVVPPAQLRDTMVLFQSPRHIRPIALRFLYWYFERSIIQSGEHSSVEDAQATLKVYEHYVQCINNDPENGLEDTLDDIYAIGAQLAWKVPDST